ncbi:MAG: cupin domain-containing protein [Gaiellaceae bacterium]
MESGVAQPLLLPPRAGELIGDSVDRRVELLSDHDALHATWSRFGPGRDGADLHIHRRHTDLFYVLEGELTLALGPAGESTVAPAGTLVRVPPLVVHGFRNGGDVELRYLNFHAPGEGFAGYLRARRDGLEASFDSEDPPANGGLSPGVASIGRGEFDDESPGLGVTSLADGDEVGIFELRLAPGSTRSFSPPGTRRGITCFYVHTGELALTAGGRELRAQAGAWVQLPPGVPHSFACAGTELVSFLQIHPRLAG